MGTFVIKCDCGFGVSVYGNRCEQDDTVNVMWGTCWQCGEKLQGLRKEIIGEYGNYEWEAGNV